jgi:hypothetical protein
MPRPCHLTYRVDPTTSAALCFTGQKLTNDIPIQYCDLLIFVSKTCDQSIIWHTDLITKHFKMKLVLQLYGFNVWTSKKFNLFFKMLIDVYQQITYGERLGASKTVLFNPCKVSHRQLRSFHLPASSRGPIKCSQICKLYVNPCL